MFGDFKGACVGHDACYSLGAERVVGLLEDRYQQSMLSATREQKAEFRAEMSRVKRSCDRSFLKDLRSACGRVNVLERPRCEIASVAYYAGVNRLAGAAFDQAIDTAFTCRTR